MKEEISTQAQEYCNKLKEVLGRYISITCLETTTEFDFEVEGSAGQNFNFATLCKVAKVFGTLDFDVNHRTEHWQYSSWSQGNDYFTNFTVQKSKLNEGLPWETK